MEEKTPTTKDNIIETRTRLEKLDREVKAAQAELLKLESRAAQEMERRYYIIEKIQDGRPQISGPFTFSEATFMAQAAPNRTVGEGPDGGGN